MTEPSTCRRLFSSGHTRCLRDLIPRSLSVSNTQTHYLADTVTAVDGQDDITPHHVTRDHFKESRDRTLIEIMASLQLKMNECHFKHFILPSVDARGTSLLRAGEDHVPLRPSRALQKQF